MTNGTKSLSKLLVEFTHGDHCEAAFRAIADHLGGLIYHTALRQSGDPTLAEEAIQMVLVEPTLTSANQQRSPLLPSHS